MHTGTKDTCILAASCKQEEENSTPVATSRNSVPKSLMANTSEEPAQFSWFMVLGTGRGGGVCQCAEASKQVRSSTLKRWLGPWQGQTLEIAAFVGTYMQTCSKYVLCTYCAGLTGG